MARHLRQRPALRGGWDVGPDEFKALGFTVGLPPNLYVPQTPQIMELSQRFEACDSLFLDIDSNFSVQSRCFLFQNNRTIRCFVRDLPPDMDPQKLKRILNQKMYQKKLTSTPECVEKVLVNPCGQFAFVDFTKSRDAERFIELKDSLDIDGHPIKIRRSLKAVGAEGGADLEVRGERQNSLILWGIESNLTDKEIREMVSQFARVTTIDVPALHGVNLGYAIFDLEDSSLTDIVALQMRVRLGVDCRRCFSRTGQRKLDDTDPIDFTGGSDSSKLTMLIESAASFTVADALNLDLELAKVVRDPSELPTADHDALRIFNVTKGSDPKELEVVVTDIRNELRHFQSLRNVFADLRSDQTVPLLGVPIVAVFTTARDAALAQREISGRRYRGRVVITMLEDGKQSEKTEKRV
jgi:hypothetical protein